MTRASRLIAVWGFVCLAWAPFAPLAKADIPEGLRGVPISRVRIDGGARELLTEKDVPVKVGTPLTRAVVRRAITALMETGAWANVEASAESVGDGVTLVLTVTPRVVVLRIDVRGTSALDRDEIVRALPLSEGSTLNDDDLAQAETTILETYAAAGYHAATCTVTSRETDRPTENVVVIDIGEGPPTRIVDIVYEGEKPPAHRAARQSLGLHPGDLLAQRAVETALRTTEETLRRRGFYEARLGPLRIERAGPRARIFLPSHFGPRYKLDVRGEWPLAKGDIAEALTLESEPLTPAALESAQDRVVDLYRRRGFRHAEVALTTHRDPKEGTAELRVTITRGLQEGVVAVTFPGARHFENGFLEGQVHSYLDEELPGSPLVDPVDSPVADVGGAGGKRTFHRDAERPPDTDPRRVYHEPTYEEAIRHIRELYRGEGFLDARVGPARILRLDERRLAVSIPVVEGPRTYLYGVTLRGQDAIAPREILTAAELERGQSFSYVSLERARIGIVDLYRDRGYYYARVEPKVAFSGDRTRADVTFEILEGYQVLVGDIVIRGTEHTDPDLVRARLSFSRGDLFRPRTAVRSQERLLDLGVFSSVNIGPADAELPERVKTIVVTVTERPGQYLESSLGFSTGEGLRGGFEYGLRNLFGHAIGLSLRVQLAYQFLFVDQQIERRFEALPDLKRLERNITLGLVFPYVPYVPDTKLALNGVLSRDNERDFGLEKLGGTVSLTWQPIRRFTLTLAEDLEQNTVELFVSGNLADYLQMNTDPRLERLLRVPEGESIIAATRAVAAVDLRDSPFTPTSGAYFAVSGEYARTLDTEREPGAPEPFLSNFVKTAATASGYVPLGKVVLATQVRIGRIFHLEDDSKTYPNRAFFLGGVDTMRGYLQDALVPQDLADQVARDPDLTVNDIVRGADAFALMRTELRFPITGDLYGGVFTDVGNSWADPSKLLEGFRLRPTAGAGIRLATPVGPLAFDYGIILVRRESLNENFGAFHFSIGLF